MYHIDGTKKHFHFVLTTTDMYRLLSITIYGNHGTTSNKTLSKPYVVSHVNCHLTL